MNPKIMLAALCLAAVVSISPIYAQTPSIPEWIKNTAEFWVKGDLSDAEFLGALQFLVEEGMLEIPSDEITKDASTSKTFPDPNKDPWEYIQRYNNEQSYRDWFDRNYPGRTIHEVVGLPEPTPEEPRLENPRENGRSSDTQAPRTITYSYSNIPYVPDPDLVKRAMINGFNTWQHHNPDLMFEQVENNGDIEIKWRTVAAHSHVGLATYSHLYSGEIEISLGKYNCNDQYVQYDEDSIRYTTMHEIGHILGLGHTLDQTHLMYGTDSIDPDTFDNFEYVIPKNGKGFFVGYSELEEQYSKYESRINEYEPRISSLLEEIEILESEYNESEYHEPRIYEDLSIKIEMVNGLIDDHNRVVEDQTNLVKVMSCYPDVIDLGDK